MSVVIGEVSIKGLRKAHFVQLHSYIADRDREGWYYGNKEHFENRHLELKEWVENILDSVNHEGVIIPKKDTP